MIVWLVTQIIQILFNIHITEESLGFIIFLSFTELIIEVVGICALIITFIQSKLER